MSAAPREIELKLEVNPTDLARIKRRLSQLSATKPVARTLVSVYFDTAHWTLRARGLSLRVRRIGRQYVQTVKSAGGPAAGLYDRGEWEHPIAGPGLELPWTAQTALGPLLRGRLAASLRPMFETRIRRTEYRLARDGAAIAADLDHGSVHAGSSHRTVCELELELLRGPPAALFGVAEALADLAPMHLSIKTKPDRGYELLRRTGITALTSAGSVRASRASTAGEAFQTIARGCLRQVIANGPAVLAREAEALHGMRVALRRLRAGISVFSRVVADRPSGKIKSELRWLEETLGPARDFDVYVADVVGPLRKRHRHDGKVKRIYQDIERRRAVLYAQVAASLQSQRLRHLELALARWIEAGPWLVNRTSPAARRRDRPVTQLAAEALTRRRKKLCKRGRCLAKLNRWKRHRVRIRAKKLRYAVGFFSEIFPGKGRAKRCRDTLSALEDLQDSLGALNDLAQQEDLSAHDTEGTAPTGVPITGTGAAAHAFAAPLSSAAREARTAQLLHEAERAFKRFCAVKPFWE